jgi:hypothetical protein
MQSVYSQEDLQVLLRDQKYKGPLPAFHNAEDFPELKPLLDNWEKIRDEVFNYEKNIGAIAGINSNEYVSAQFEGINWSNMYLDNFMWRFHNNRKHFPFICSVVDQIPNATLAVLSVLSPHSSIKPHFGDTNGIVRCQLGLSIPAAPPVCSIKVADEERGWENGKLTLFTEAYLHSVWNNSPEKRYLLIVDIVPSYIPESKISVCAKVLGAQTWNYFECRFTILKKIPMSILPFFHAALSLAWRIYLPFQRKLPFL